jgi:ABC-type branched-subunit amino acid transport system substrate-binding protein
MRRALAIVACALAVATAPAAPAADDATASGRRIFARGGALGEVLATFSGTTTPLPPAVRRCAGCHGPDGAGSREGGVAIPPIGWMALAAPRAASPAQPGRPGYDLATLARALVEGIDPAGRPLAPGMPRFRLTSTQLTALSDYLAMVGTGRDLDPGIAADEIRVGAVLPLSGAQAAWGRAMRAGLETALAAAGKIYGRRLRLVTADAGNDAAAALRHLLAGDQVFALLATMLPAGVEEALEVPVIGPLTPTPAQPSPNQFYLLAPIGHQMRRLVDELASETPHPLRLAIIGPQAAAADAVAEQATRDGAMVVGRTTVADLAAVLPPAIEPAPDAVLALPGVDLGRLAAQLADRPDDVMLAGSAEAVTPETATDQRLRLVLPVWPGETRGRDPSSAEEAPPLAISTADVLIEGLKRMGARASRAGLCVAIESLHDFPAGAVPPQGFGRGQHTGSRASVVVRPDGKDGIIVIGGWRAPR